MFVEAKCNVTALSVLDTVEVKVYVSPEITKQFLSLSYEEIIPSFVKIVIDPSFLFPALSVIDVLISVSLSFAVALPVISTLAIELSVSWLICTQA